MYNISGKALAKLIPLLRNSKIDFPITLGILDGTFSGHAIVDNTALPRKALVIHTHIGFLQYLGDEPSDIESVEIAEHLINYRSDRSYCNWVEIANCPDSVVKIINAIYPEMKSYNRISWNHDPNFLSTAPVPFVPEGCSITFLSKENFKNKFLRYETEMFWDTTSVFLKKAFGTVAMDNNGNFMGVCGAVSASGNFSEINIEVAKEHRRKGIGYAVAYSFIKECYKRGNNPHWDCFEHNIPSQALAKKLGFIEAGRYPLVSWDY